MSVDLQNTKEKPLIQLFAVEQHHDPQKRLQKTTKRATAI
jgi:hypothetical protein